MARCEQALTSPRRNRIGEDVDRSALDWLWFAAGGLLVVTGLNDVFHTLLHPGGRGRLTGWMMEGIWRAARRVPAGLRAGAGPAACLAVVAGWAALQVVGWALIYYPLVPDGFLYSPGLDERRYGDFEEALYFSIVALSTVGFGDVVISAPGLRVVAVLESVAGLALLTAAISWFLQLNPTLAARRALALRLALLRESDFAGSLARDPLAGASALQLLAADIAEARVELAQNAESYYFHVSDARMALPETLPYALTLSETATESGHAGLDASGRLLRHAVQDFAALISDQFRLGPGRSPEEVLEAYAADHRSARTGR